MINCIYCGAESAEENNFCGQCYRQIKCTNLVCGNILTANAPICLKCGRQIGVGGDTNLAPNLYEEITEQTPDSYKHRKTVRASNEAVNTFAPIMLGNSYQRPQNPPVNFHKKDEAQTLTLPPTSFTNMAVQIESIADINSQLVNIL